MAEHWVLNASPLIVLCRVGQEELFFALADELAVPRAVAIEVEAGPSDDAARHFLTIGRLPIVDTPSPPAEIVAWDLGSGETAVMAYALANPVGRPFWTMGLLANAVECFCLDWAMIKASASCSAHSAPSAIDPEGIVAVGAVVKEQPPVVVGRGEQGNIPVIDV